MARGRKASLRIGLAPEAHATVERWQRSTTVAAGLVRRGNIILRLAAGYSHADVGRSVGVQRTVVRTWAKRFLAQRLDGLSDAPGRGAKGGFSPGGRDPRGTPRLQASGFAGPQPLPGGWPRTGAGAHRRGDRCGDLHRHRAPEAGLASTQTLAPAWRARSQAAAGRRLLGHRVCVDRPLHAATASG
jgi:hypothetical protein